MGEGAARTGHAPQLSYPGRGSWCIDTPTVISYCWRVVPPGVDSPAPPAYQQGQWQEKAPNESNVCAGSWKSNMNTEMVRAIGCG